MPASPRSGTARDAARPQATPSNGRGLLVAIAGMLVVGVGAGWWLARPRVDRVADTIALQREVLAGGAVASRRGDVDRIIRSVDHMSRDEIKQVRAALAKEWERMRGEMAGRYRAAPADKRPALVEADLDRWMTFRELLLAVSPGADPRQASRPPKPRPGKAAPDRGGAAAEDLYVEAIRNRAKARGLPFWDVR